MFRPISEATTMINGQSLPSSSEEEEDDDSTTSSSTLSSVSTTSSSSSSSASTTSSSSSSSADNSPKLSFNSNANCNVLLPLSDGENSDDSFTYKTPDLSPLFIYETGEIRFSIFPKDVECLRDSEYLNDQIIDFWMTVISTEVLADEDRKRTFIFDCFFYQKFSTLKNQMEKYDITAEEKLMNSHAGVLNRTKHVDIFSKDFVVIPINLNEHWIVAIICFPGTKKAHRCRTKRKTINNRFYTKFHTEYNVDTAQSSRNTRNKRRDNSEKVWEESCILVFDSYEFESESRHQEISSTLRDYLTAEYRAKKNEDRVFDSITMPDFMPDVLRQSNTTDCGLFMLQYVESFFITPIRNFHVENDTKIIDLKEWFDPSQVESKRWTIHNMIRYKVFKTNPENVNRIPKLINTNDQSDDFK